MFKKKKINDEREDVAEKPYAGYSITTEIVAKKYDDDSDWETVGTIKLGRSSDLKTWERYSSGVKAIDREYQQALVTVLRGLNAIIADTDDHDFKLDTDVTQNPN